MDLKRIEYDLSMLDNFNVGLGEWLKRKHEGTEKFDLEGMNQHVLDLHYNIQLLKDLIVEVNNLQDLDPKSKSYLDTWHKKYNEL